jgi:hypothetical protein
MIWGSGIRQADGILVAKHLFAAIVLRGDAPQVKDNALPSALPFSLYFSPFRCRRPSQIFGFRAEA